MQNKHHHLTLEMLRRALSLHRKYTKITGKEKLMQLEGVHRTLTPRRALDVVREVGAWIWIRDQEQGYHNKRKAAISHGRIRRSTQQQQSHTEEHERIRCIARGANNKK